MIGFLSIVDMKLRKFAPSILPTGLLVFSSITKGSGMWVPLVPGEDFVRFDVGMAMSSRRRLTRAEGIIAAEGIGVRIYV